MSEVVIRAEGIGKLYQLGEISTGTLSRDLTRWWATVRGKENPYAKIGEVNDRTAKGGSDYVWALQDISFEVKQGEVLGIIGRNGAGKSTLLKILSRVTKPTTGRIRVKGRIASLLEVGTGFHPELTGRENIFLNGAILGMRKTEIRQKLDEIIAFAGVERYIDTPVKRYSSGMYVRLAFAVAAHLDPEILVIDEVLAVGDAEFQKKCLGKMKDVSEKEGRTVLFVSHDITAISSLTKRCILMNKGEVEANGPTREVLHTYLLNQGKSNLTYNAPKSDLKPSVTRVEIKTNLPNNHHICLQTLTVEFDLHTPFPIRNSCLSFQIVNERNNAIAHLWVFDSEQPFCRDTGTFRLTCTIPTARVYMGNYFLKVYFTGPPGGEVYDILDSVCPFSIQMLGSHREFKWQPDACAYLEDSEWNVRMSGGS